MRPSTKRSINTHVKLQHDGVFLPSGRRGEGCIFRGFDELHVTFLEEGRDGDSAGWRGRVRITAGGENDAAVIGRRGVIWRSDVHEVRCGGVSALLRSGDRRRRSGVIRRLAKVTCVYVSHNTKRAIGLCGGITWRTHTRARGVANCHPRVKRRGLRAAVQRQAMSGVGIGSRRGARHGK